MESKTGMVSISRVAHHQRLYPRCLSSQLLSPWPNQVAEYRAYIVDSQGHFASFRAFVCDGDDEAITWARQLKVDGHAVELWSGERFILRLPATSS